MGIPLTFTILNLIKSDSFVANKSVNKDSFNPKIIKDFGRICQLIN